MADYSADPTIGCFFLPELASLISEEPGFRISCDEQLFYNK
jgi:hypothetical protein